jgi:AraC-like DNA-binding protein
LIIQLIVSLLIFNTTQSVMREEISAGNQRVLKQIQDVIDGYLYETKKVAMLIGFNNRVKSLINAGDNIKNTDMFNIYEIMREMVPYTASNSFMEGIYIYNKQTDSVIGSSNHLLSEDFFNLNYDSSKISFDSWKEIVDGVHNNEFFLMPAKDAYGQSLSKIIFLQSLPLLDREKSQATLLIIINNEHIKDILQNANWEGKDRVFIINKSNQIIACASDEAADEPFVKFDYLGGDSGLMPVKYNNKPAMLAYGASEHTDWKYVSIIPESIFWQRLVNVRNLMIVIISLLTAVGFVVLYFLVLRNYKPISELISNWTQKMSFEKKDNINEYKLLNLILSQTVDENTQISLKLEQQKKVMRANFLSKLLKGRVDDDLIMEKALPYYDINFHSDSFAVMLFYIEDYDNIFYDSGDLNTDEKIKFTHFIIQNVTEELVNRDNYGLVFEMDDMLACLVNFKEDRPDNKEKLLELADYARKFIYDNFNIRFTVAISRACKTMVGIPIAYQEALHALEYRMLIGREKIIHYDDTVRFKGANYYYPLENEQQIINYIKAGDYENASRCISEVFDDTAKIPNNSPKIMKYFVADMLSTVIKAVHSINMHYDIELTDEIQMIEKVFDINTLEDIKQQIYIIVKRICRHVGEYKSNNNEPPVVVKEVVRFIEENYKDSNLAIATIADYFNLNPDYLSRIFKGYTGESMLHYINRLRVNMAKKLLKETNMGINDIMTESGFTNSSSFFRIFKKREGITPNQYRVDN